jgi:flavin reductase (DIM6/NTAB) family NADH-FMN oxidoreductase RutF
MDITKTVFDPVKLEPVDVYKLMIGLIVPRPIGWVGTRSADDTLNLAPFSFFNGVASQPPTVIFSSGMTTRDKDSLANVRATGEFTLNIVTEDLAEAMVLTAGEYRADVDEFAIAGLTAVTGDLVGAPLVAEAKANMECKVTQIVEVGDPPSSAVVFGEVVRFHVSRSVLDGTRVDPVALQAVGRMAGTGYTRTRELFFIDRPAL